jgi:hypothetical protein
MFPHCLTIFPEPRIKNHGLENLKKKIPEGPLASGCPSFFFLHWQSRAGVPVSSSLAISHRAELMLLLHLSFTAADLDSGRQRHHRISIRHHQPKPSPNPVVTTSDTTGGAASTTSNAAVTACFLHLLSLPAPLPTPPTTPPPLSSLCPTRRWPPMPQPPSPASPPRSPSSSLRTSPTRSSLCPSRPPPRPGLPLL